MNDGRYRELVERAIGADHRIRRERWDTDYGPFQVAASAREGVRPGAEPNPVERVPGGFRPAPGAESWVLICPKHPESAARPWHDPPGYVPTAFRPYLVEMRPQTFADSAARGGRTLVFLGQCPDCETIYYAVFVPALKRVD